MKEYVKSHKLEGMMTVLMWVIVLGMLIKASFTYNSHLDGIVSADAFATKAIVTQNEDRVGANVWLKQTIHGTDGITYRYVIETDCPKWDFETRYMTSTPIEWISETSAVEVVVYDTQIRYDGTVYASGQYYTVPLFDNISSENITLEEWQVNLVKQAYQAYTTDMIGQKANRDVLTFLVIALPVMMLVWIYTSKRKRQDKSK